jgi:hypothetical protein
MTSMLIILTCTRWKCTGENNRDKDLSGTMGQ